jgi:hypothetical protein
LGAYNSGLSLILIFWGLVFLPAHGARYEMPAAGPYPGCGLRYEGESADQRPRAPLRELPDDAPAAIEIVRDEIGRILTEKSEEGLVNPGGGCLPCSSALREVLGRLGGITTQRLEVAHSEPLKVNGVPRDNFTYHFFLVIPAGKNREEIIVDSTYLQFLHPSAHAELPRVFVGTRQELIALFSKHSSEIRRQTPRPPVAEKIDPVEFIDLTYGYGRAATARRVE